ncbi:hypothetical protein K2173_014601 [Erythroxylum novogranatense]|uniref:ATP synthase F0 subunit 8 n=1 Tax=Erythroxylum novogranatense TaxID=1862640 RepID=A0AAV8THJ1_9ROSI|nr:hypothetical protein K2173_014601 [Erythroxylum novogranatense]
MYEFGDELTIESYRIPWLIWIQLLILFLLIFLLFCFSFFGSDSSDTNSSCSSSSGSPSTSGLFMSHDPNLDKSVLKLTNSRTTATAVTKRYRRTQAGETQRIKGETTTNIGRRIVTDDLASSSEDTNFIDYHPCNYFRLAKLAFLKCFGFDHILDNSSSSDEGSRERR